MAETVKLDALVVGAGFAGLYMLHKLREQGLSAQVVEAGKGVGGTWYWNRYPGARCDIPSVEYSFSFSPELERDWRWSERYAPQPEILAYLEHVADRFDLNRNIQFETRVTAAQWDEAATYWHVETDRGQAYTAHYLILATGALSAPNLPDLPGLDSFTGTVLHTAKWDESVDLTGRNVALFGTGSSGIQVTPELAKRAAQLTVFQRTPNFAVPAGNHPLSDEYLAEIAPQLPGLREQARQSPLGFFATPSPGLAKEATADARAQRLEQHWAAGTTGLLLAYEDLLFDEESNSHAAEFARSKIAGQINDPETARKVTPQGYPLGSRRLCSEIGFYDALNRDNVAVVDVREEPVTQITGDAIQTSDGTYPADVIVFATGFDAVVGAINAIDIRGEGGRSLREEWADGPRAYLGLAVAGFPNLFTITGPGSPSVLSNVVLSIEQHVEWIAQCLSDLDARGVTRLEAQADAEQEWMEHSDAIAQQTLFPRANSWYHGRTRDGRRVFLPYLGGCGAYRDKCNAVAADNYAGFDLGRD
ncbi:SidA/IucD/PvdA family monooxygenase [Altererythrobacter xixiisoli]|uniref:SidA/IucD/PvdA family monooxygenase n=1 Tax=Croceibacterium xixiisoli TaxID=1476466 RepID=A0A6I4TTQ6_9SPHN|nr:NAD(P)/FAD-dependent oxidoreductase [Croceibacterium xixiisoli]MXO98620.1 SidA/IucD/PvdA family monooxygenase [Croceibacterium xixiisoli]